MDFKRLAAAAQAAVGVSALTFGIGPVTAPLDPPPPCTDCADAPAPPPIHPYTPQAPVMRVGPGGPKGGGGQPVYQQPVGPAHLWTPPPPPPAG
jgi:hypothetical protein